MSKRNPHRLMSSTMVRIAYGAGIHAQASDDPSTNRESLPRGIPFHVSSAPPPHIGELWTPALELQWDHEQEQDNG